MPLAKIIAREIARLALLLSCATALAAPPSPDVKLGKPVNEAELAAWNIDINTKTGAGLPSGKGTAVEGKAVFEAKCAACHGAEAKGGPMFGPMVGGIGSLATDKPVLTPGSMYPYAPILFDYIYRAMPMNNPQSLKSDEVYSLSAYILHLNGLIGANEEMNRQSLAAVKMPNRGNFIADNRPDTKAERCMKDCK
jgi:cytochrome c